MANIFAAITAVLLLASAYVAFKNQQAYEKEIEDSQTAQKDLDVSRDRLAQLRKDRDNTKQERIGVEEDTVAKQEVESERKSGNEKLQGDITAKRQDAADKAERIAEIEDQTKELGPIRELEPKIRRMRTEITGLEDDKAGKEAKLANLISNKNSTESTIESYRKQNDAFANQRSFFDSARISAIYGPWGFVTLSAGNNSGVVTNSTLDVVRGGEVIAKLRVRSVESSRSSADIIPDSMADDVTLMAGDRVVPAAVEEEKAPDPAAAEPPDQPLLDPDPAPAAPDAGEPDSPLEEDLDFDF
ncbi:hypothetical protein [Haloferula sp. A504]|uniref:hypothetical protein n=1 Tax=Haloferula sp. A504 TaxID=3373601 RepID=UPI0031C7B043|nr:hypothetical protein [Verrucomicrobiaceae bacterium E54]